MDYKSSLKHKINDKIKKLIDLQNIDIEIIKTCDARKALQEEWNSIAQQSESINQDFEKNKNIISEIETGINNKQEDLDNISKEISKLSALQGEAKKVEEYNFHQQKIVESTKKARELENTIDDLQNRKDNINYKIVEIEKRLEDFHNSFQAKSKRICESIKTLNNNGRKLIESKKEQLELMQEEGYKELLDKYENLIKKKMNKVVVPIEEKSCHGCNILLTNSEISVIKRGLSIHSCEHCSRMLYFPQALTSESKTSTKKKKVFNISP